MSFSNKDISLKKYKNGYVLKVNSEMNFDQAMDALKKDLIDHADILGESMIVGVQEYVFDPLQKGKIVELIGKYSHLSVKSLEPTNIYKVSEKKQSEKKKTEKSSEKGKKKLFKELDQFKLKNQMEYEVSDFQISEEPKEEDEPVVEIVEKVQATASNKKEKKSGVAKQPPEEQPREEQPPAKDEGSKLSAEDMKTVFYRGTVRSGNTLQSQGHLVIIGDVNEGSELYAAGNIVVVGTLRGMAHAGCEGDESAFIMANKLLSNQIRISRHISIKTEEQSSAKNLKIAEIVDHNIVIK